MSSVLVVAPLATKVDHAAIVALQVPQTLSAIHTKLGRRQLRVDFHKGVKVIGLSRIQVK